MLVTATSGVAQGMLRPASSVGVFVVFSSDEIQSGQRPQKKKWQKSMNIKRRMTRKHQTECFRNPWTPKSQSYFFAANPWHPPPQELEPDTQCQHPPGRGTSSTGINNGEPGATPGAQHGPKIPSHSRKESQHEVYQSDTQTSWMFLAQWKQHETIIAIIQGSNLIVKGVYIYIYL